MAIELVTPRLLLRKLVPEDSKAMFAYRSDRDVIRFQNWDVGEMQQITSFIEAQSSLQMDIPGTWFQLAITLKNDKKLIGDCGLHFLADVPRQVEVGMTISPQYQKNGYASEALKALLSFSFETLGKHRVYGSADGRNQASMTLMERAGMRREAYFRQSYWCKGEWTDDVIYAILASEWQENTLLHSEG